MCRQPRLLANPQWHRLWWAAAVLAIAVMPTSYRGGADIPHPHAFFQFWGRAADEAFDHHAAHRHVQVVEHGHGGTADTEVAGRSPVHDVPALTEASAHGEQTVAPLALAACLAQFPRRHPWLRALLAPLVRPFGRLLRPEPPPPRALTG